MTGSAGNGRAAIATSLGVLLCLGAGLASAQSVQVQLPPAPYYVGDAIELQIVADGFDEDPTPAVEWPDRDADRLEYRGVAPSVNTSITIIGGQVRRTKQVRFVFSYRLRIAEPGTHTLGPFAVVQGATRRVSRPVRVDMRAVPTHDRLGVQLILPDAPIYLGERVPVTVQFRVRGQIRENLHDYTLRVPFFDRSDQFRFLDPPDPGETDVKIETSAGELKMKGHAREGTRNGEKELVVSVTRIAVPLREGVLDVPATVLDVEEGTRYRRDLFGGRKPTRVRRWRASDRERQFVVERIPTDAQTPPSFAGAVGSGFSLRVSADRTVVQVGEPIALTIELRGDGNLEAASLPKLDTPGLLPAAQFRVPGGELAGRLEDATKTFTAMVRVVDPNVTEIPALTYAWFDPESRRFQTTESRPIALSVRAGQVIGAGQVEREPQPDAPGVASSSAEPTATGAATGRTGALVLTGADLAIERDIALLTRAASGDAASLGFVFGLYGFTALLIFGALLDRRRRDVDPALVQRRRRVRTHLQEIRAAESLPARDAASAIAAAVRALVAECPEANTREVDALLGECDARSYAPAGDRDPAPADSAFVSRALELAEQIAGNVG